MSNVKEAKKEIEESTLAIIDEESLKTLIKKVNELEHRITFLEGIVLKIADEAATYELNEKRRSDYST